MVQSNGHRASLSFGAVSEPGREGRLPPLSSGSPEAQEGQSHAAWNRRWGASERSPLRRAAPPAAAAPAPAALPASPEHENPPPPMLETLGFISAASARKPGSAQAQCSPPQSRTEEGGSGAQHLRSGLSRINTKSLLYLPSNLNLSKFPLAVLELREEEILPTV